MNRLEKWNEYCFWPMLKMMEGEWFTLPLQKQDEDDTRRKQKECSLQNKSKQLILFMAHNVS